MATFKKVKSPLKKTKKKFGLYAIWGTEDSDQFDENGKISLKANGVNYYSFATKAERNAFLDGVAESNGWNEYTFVEEEKSKIEKGILIQK